MENNDRPTTTAETTAVYIIAAAAVILRLAALGGPLLWYDETFSAWLARLPAAQLVAATAGDMHPPLYYLVLWCISHALGAPTAWALRFPSLLAGLAALPLAWRLAALLGLDRRARLVTMALMAALPFQLYFSQEARMYAMLQAFVLGLYVAVLQRKPAAVFLCAVGALYTHNYAPLYLAAAFFLPALRCRTIRAVLDVRHAAPFILAGLAWLPWLVTLAGQLGTVGSGYWLDLPTPGDVVYSLYALFFVFNLDGNMIGIGQMLVTAALLWALVYLVRERRGAALPVLAFAPLLVCVALSYAWRPVLLWRCLIGSAPMLYMLVAQAAAALPGRRALIVAAAAAPVLAVWIAGYYSGVYTLKNGTAQSAPQVVIDQQLPGDRVLHINEATALRWMYYAPGLDQRMLTGCPRAPSDMTDSTIAAMGMPLYAVDAPRPSGRTWVVVGLSPVSNACDYRAALAYIAGARPVSIYNQSDQMFYGIYLLDQANPYPAPAALGNYDPAHAAWSKLQDRAQDNFLQNAALGLALCAVWWLRPRALLPWVEPAYSLAFVALVWGSLAWFITVANVQ